jgi:hypothetical protein
MVQTTTFLTTVKTAVKTVISDNSTYLAVGTGTTAATAADTTLETEVTRKARQEVTTGTSDVIVSLFLNSTESNSNSLTEVGVFDAAAAGNMIQRDTFTAIAKTSSIEVWIDVETQVTVTQ